MARRAVGTEIVKVMTDIDPSEVLAHGAAVLAQWVMQDPKTFMVDKSVLETEDWEHDEL